MGENLKWLWAAFTVAWALHVAYVTLLSRRTKKIEGEIETLRAQLQEQDTDAG